MLLNQPTILNNISANFVGNITGILIQIIFTPIYLHFLGIEAYGLVVFYITLQGSITFLEMGLGSACNRQLARYSGQGKDGFKSIRITLHTLEWVYWLLGLAIGILFTLSSPWISRSWLSSVAFSPDTLQEIVFIMGWLIAIRWPISLYKATLMGMQLHVRMNLTQIGLSLITAVGTVIVLWKLETSIQAFFKWNLTISAMSVIFFTWLAWQSLPKAKITNYFSWPMLRQIWYFASVLGFNQVLGTILRQSDKIIVSTLLPLKQFAYYGLASLITQIIPMVADAVSNSVFPQFSKMVGGKTLIKKKIFQLYQETSQFTTVMIVPLMLTLVFFSEKVLLIYTGDYEIALNVSSILVILAIAKFLHANMLIPYVLQLSYGWVSLSLYINIVSLLFLIPTLYFLTMKFGVVGSALSWLFVTLGYVLIGIPIMYKKLLIGKVSKWFLDNLIYPLFFITGLMVLVKQIPFGENRWLVACQLVVIITIAIILCAFLMPKIRFRLIKFIK